MTDPQDTPECCNWRGMVYPDGGKRCQRHVTKADRELVAELDRRAKPILAGQDWPYGPNIDVRSRQRLVDWAEPIGLKRAKTSCQELHWLRKGRCGVVACTRMGRWMDHVTRWSLDGRPAVLVAQPYGLMNDDVAALGQVAGFDDLIVHIGHRGGWYGYGTTFIELWRADARQQHLDGADARHAARRPAS